MNCMDNMYFDTYIESIKELLKSFNFHVFCQMGAESVVMSVIQKKGSEFLYTVKDKEFRNAHGFYKFKEIKEIKGDKEKVEVFFDVLG